MAEDIAVFDQAAALQRLRHDPGRGFGAHIHLAHGLGLAANGYDRVDRDGGAVVRHDGNGRIARCFGGCGVFACGSVVRFGIRRGAVALHQCRTRI